MEASSAMVMVENRSSESLAHVGLQLGLANSKLVDVEAKADEEYAAAAKVPIMKELLDEELTAANDELIRITNKKEREKATIADQLDQLRRSYEKRESLLSSEVKSEKERLERYQKRLNAEKRTEARVECDAADTAGRERELRKEYDQFLDKSKREAARLSDEDVQLVEHRAHIDELI